MLLRLAIVVSPVRRVLIDRTGREPTRQVKWHSRDCSCKVGSGLSDPRSSALQFAETRSCKMNTTGTRLSDSCREKSGHIVAGWLCPGTKAAHAPLRHAFPRACRHQYRPSRTKIDFSCNTFTGARKV